MSGGEPRRSEPATMPPESQPEQSGAHDVPVAVDAVSSEPSRALAQNAEGFTASPKMDADHIHRNDHAPDPSQDPPEQPQEKVFFESASALPPLDLGVPAAYDSVPNSATPPANPFSAFPPPGELEPARPSPHPTTPRRPELHRDASASSTVTTNTIRAARPWNGPYVKDESAFPVFPDQSYAALQYQVHPPPYPRPALRTRNSQPLRRYPHASFSSAGTMRSDDFLHSVESGSRTVGSSPVSSPSLFTPGGTPRRNDLTDVRDGYSSPFLHYTHRQPPKETHVADVEFDPISGRKMINHYEIIDELGRGVHGKVKLGRDTETDQHVAIKIVERYSKRKRLGKTGSHEDKIKREIAILKKARHPNIVSLREVIDDPSLKKVYIVLEHVEMGEVKWRTEGEPEITLIEYRRYQRESQGRFNDLAALREDEEILEEAARKRKHEEKRRARELALLKQSPSGPDLWSIEHGTGSEGDASSFGDRSRNPSILGDYPNADSYSNSYEAYQMETRPRRNSVAPPSPLTGERTLTGPLNHGEGSSTCSDTAQHHQTRYEFESNGLDGTMYGAYESYASGRQTPCSASDTSSPVLGLNDLDNVPEHFKFVPLMTLQATRSAFRDTVLGLEYLHYQGVIHRDIKPANLLETKDRRIKISDFGVSYLGREARPSGEDQSEPDEVDEAVELAKTVGTPAFYAPELCNTDLELERQPITEQIDVWALGVTLYCLVYGRVPFHDHSTFALMRMIAEQDVYIPRRRLKAVDDRPTRGPRPFSPARRRPHELEYEDVDDELYDLLHRLFIKDPTQRITLAEVKHHPWILAGIHDPETWLAETDPSRQTQGKRIQVSKEDVAEAVVPLTVVERMRSIVSKIGGAIGASINRSTSSRRRAKSNGGSNADSGAPSAASSSSTISQDGRRFSPRVDESMASTFRCAREGEHPLSRSVVASPLASEPVEFFGTPSRPESPYPSRKSSESLPHDSGRSRTSYGQHEISTDLPLRSTRTLKSSRSGSFGEGTVTTIQEGIAQGPSDQPQSVAARGIWEGASNILRTVRSRDRRAERSRSKESITSFSDSQHGEPTLGFSRAVAGGYLDTPGLLRDTSTPASSAAASPLSSRAPSVTYTELSKHGSSSSLAANERFLPLTFDPEPRPSSRQTFQPAEERLMGTKEELQRRIWKDSHGHGSNLAHAVCPPSPDTLPFRKPVVEATVPATLDGTLHHARAAFPTQVASSSSEDQFTSGMSQSTSHPSMPSVASATSSVPEEDDFTVKGVKAPVAPIDLPAPPVSPHVVFAPSPPRRSHDEDDGYTPDDYARDEPADSDDSDDFLVMGRNRPPRHHGLGRSQSVSNAELARRRPRRATTISSVKSTASGGITIGKGDRHSIVGDDLSSYQEGAAPARWKGVDPHPP